MSFQVIKRRPEMTMVLAEHRLRKNLDQMIEDVTENTPYGTPEYEDAVAFLKGNVMLVLERLQNTVEECERLTLENQRLQAGLAP